MIDLGVQYDLATKVDNLQEVSPMKLFRKKEKVTGTASDPFSSTDETAPTPSAPPLPANSPAAVSKSSAVTTTVVTDQKNNSYGAITTGLGGPQDPTQLKLELGKEQYLEGEKYMNLSQFYKAIDCYKQAAPHYLPAYYRLFYIYYFCMPGKFDDKTPELYIELGRSLLTIETAVLERKSSDPIDYFTVACCYFYQCGGMSKDPIDAVKLLTLAAEKGHGFAQCMLGKCYLKGQGIDRDPKLATHWFNQAALQGIAEAEYELGMCYRDGNGVTSNLKTALDLIQRASNKNYMDAQNVLGNAYFLGSKVGPRGLGLKQDYDKAFQLYKDAGERGHAKAQNNLGTCYNQGKGVRKDIGVAKEWWKKSADQGLEAAARNLGMANAPKKKPKRRFYVHGYHFNY